MRETSGTTATFVIVDEWTVTVTSVGDSRCVLDTQGETVANLTVDHRLEDNVEECVDSQALCSSPSFQSACVNDQHSSERVSASRGEVGRFSIFGGAELSPLRCWPGGLCLSRSIRDMDVREFILPVPHVKQVKSNVGGRFIIVSDGIWDALSSDAAAKACRGFPAEISARQIEALQTRGLRDDMTCIVVDKIPPDDPATPSTPPKNLNKLKALLCGCKSRGSGSKLLMKLSVVSIVEELFEEGSAVLAERLGADDSSEQSSSGLFVCVVCQEARS